MTIHAHIRISTDKQDEKSQRQIICNAFPAAVTKQFSWSSDTASGGMPWQQRELAQVLARSISGDTIVVSEVSRIARSTVGVLTFLQAAAERNIVVIIVKSGIKIDGSMSSKIVITVLGMAAEIERDLLRARTKASLAARKANGLPVGRQVGAKGKRNKLDGKMPDIQKLLDSKVSKSAIARLMQCSRQTLDTYLSIQEGEPC